MPATLTASGLPTVLSQTFRTLLRSRMQVGLENYRHQFPASDLLLFEPNPDDGEMFFANVFSYANRQHVAEHAFRSTLTDLRNRREVLAPLLAAHGIRLRKEVLDDADTSMLAGINRYRPRPTVQSRRLRRALDDLDISVRDASEGRERAPRRKAVRR